MSVSPDFSSFEKTYSDGRPQLVWRTLVNDLEKPVSAYLKLAEHRKNAFLLESVEGGEQLGRFSIIGFKPDVIWRCCGAQSEINRDAAADLHAFEPEAGDPLDNLKQLLAESELAPPEGAPPMAAGVFGYLGYDMVRQMERLGPKPEGGLHTPDALFIRPTVVAILDNVRQEISLFSAGRPEPGVSARAAYSRAAERLADAVSDLQAPLAHAPHTVDEAHLDAAQAANTSEADYKSMVAQAKDYIAAGDIFQVVLSQRFEANLIKKPIDIYKKLRVTNPSPFMFFFNFTDFQIIGASPEILVRLRNNEITIRPIAGTRPRGKTVKEDRFYEKDLLKDKKELSEHLMLLDLGRNDAGKVSKINSVKVTESFIIEKYSHVMHIVSNVEGVFNKKFGKFDTLLAGFPAGTVSGAPKIRAMEIIDELETTRRKVYAGGIGYFSSNGDFDTCIALRTAISKNKKFYVQSGAGIVADSKPINEFNETVNKAKALIKALE